MRAELLYRHTSVALLRAATEPLTAVPERWPDLADPHACRTWLAELWARPILADAVREASPSLAAQVEAIVAGRTRQLRRVRRATVPVARYLLRLTGRPTPFGLFAGVAPATIGTSTQVWWGGGHRPVARVDALWLASVVDELEAIPELLERLDVVFTSLAVRRGAHVAVARTASSTVQVRITGALRTVREIASVPVRFGILADKLMAAHPRTGGTEVRKVLAGLVRQGVLITCLRAPMTCTDPLAHVLDQLRAAGAGSVPSVVPLLRALEAVRAGVNGHNELPSADNRRRARADVRRLMSDLSAEGRTPLALDLLLDGAVRVPEEVVDELAAAAGALLRLTREPTGPAVWRDYHRRFWERYGTGTLVPLAEVTDSAIGLGFPATYPGSMLTPPAVGASARDGRLLALAWQAVADGSREIVLNDAEIDTLAGDARVDERQAVPHVELAARIHAADRQALDEGDFRLTVCPARSAGTLTSRFTPAAAGTGLEEVYRTLPSATIGALRAQLSVPPVYPHSENVGRIPLYLPYVIPVGEHRPVADEEDVIQLDDLAVTATNDRLHLVSIARRRIVEPQVLHALALDKQLPPIARFLAHLPRAFAPAWTGFDWGPHAAELPFLPRVRYRRTVLSPARWHLPRGDFPPGDSYGPAWQTALGQWRRRWYVPDTVELRDEDRTLRLTLTEPVHASILHAHLMAAQTAVLTEAAEPDAYGWIGGHAHEIAVPLVTTHDPAPSPLAGPLPVQTSQHLGRMPGSADAPWLNAKIFTHPDRFTEVLIDHLPRLLDELGQPRWWFIRYRSSDEPGHLRLRLGLPLTAVATTLANWAHGLRREHVAGRLVLDTYRPETGRYGTGDAMAAAEAVFVADSEAVAAGLRHLPASGSVSASASDLRPWVVAGMADIVRGLLGTEEGMRWLAERPAPVAPGEYALADAAVRLAQPGAVRAVTGWGPQLDHVWQERTKALAVYRGHLESGPDVDRVLESLLHMHHNRLRGLDLDGENTCRRWARQAGRAWVIQREQTQ